MFDCCMVDTVGIDFGMAAYKVQIWRLAGREVALGRRLGELEEVDQC